MLDDFGEEDLKKSNRRKKQQTKKHSIVVGAPPPLGIHTEDRKQRDRRRNLTVKKVLK